jgi:hypothetical protein
VTKGCAYLCGEKDPVKACNDLREFCADPKFYCRICNTDKCNKEEAINYLVEEGGNVGTDLQQQIIP